MTLSDLLGFLAATLTTVSFVPQAWLAVRTRNTAGISLTMYALFLCGITAWLAYGLMIASWPIIIANAITIALASLVFGIALQNILKARRQRLSPAADGLASPATAEEGAWP